MSREYSLAVSIQRLGREARARTGAEDVRLLKRLKLSSRIAEAIGRVCLHFGRGPLSFCAGVAGVAYCLAVEAQLNHSITHGAYRGLPGAGRFTPDRYESLAIPFQSRTWRDAHRIHHANPSLLEDDPDTVHPFFRVHSRQRWRPWHLLNSFIGALFTFEAWAFDYDAFLKRRGRREPSDRSELGKFTLYVLYQFVLFPVLAGAHWRRVLVGALLATVIRNVIFSGLQTGSSVGHRVSTRHCENRPKKGGPAWYRFQIETSKNFLLRGVSMVLCGGLDRHIEHHLFPSLPPNRLHALSPTVRTLCRHHGVRYEEHPSFWSSLADSVSYLARLSKRDGR